MTRKEVSKIISLIEDKINDEEFDIGDLEQIKDDIDFFIEQLEEEED